MPDVEYADLTRAMRTGEQPETVFDALTRRGQICTHPDVTELHREIADQVLADRKAGRTVAVVASTRDEVSELNGVIREAMITGGMVDDIGTVTTRAGSGSGLGTSSRPVATTAILALPTATPGPSPASPGMAASR